MGINGKITFFPDCFLATKLLIAVDSDKVQRVINKLKVGSTNIYRPIPASPTLLVKNILITIAKILVINPPNIKISVDLINLFFIIKYMFL